MAAKIKSHSQSGFTLIEVILAVVILAGALVVFIGLQAAVINQTLRDQSRSFAVLAARRILARIELEDGNMEDLDLSDSLDQVLEKYGLPDPDEKDLSEKAKQYQAHLKVAFAQLNLPLEDAKQQQMQQELLKRVDINISWGDAEIDQVNLTYFTPFLTP